MSKVLIIDLGTTYFKVCLFDAGQRLLAHHRISVPVEHTRADRSELSVDSFCRCLTASIQEISRQSGGLPGVTHVSFASQANTFTLLDANFEPLMPFLLWTDERARDSEAQLTELAARPDFYRTTGVAELNHLFSPAKIRWLLENEPDIVSRAHHLCFLSDYFIWWLTGNHLTEASLAGLTGLADIHHLRWWPEAIRILDVPDIWLPKIVRAGSDVGPLQPARAQELGLPPDCRCVMGCLDQYAGAIGAGVTNPGQICETTGTVLATVTCANEFSPEVAGGVYQGPSPDSTRYYRMMFSRVGAGLLERYRTSLRDHPPFSELDALAASVPSGSGGLRLHPNAPDMPVEAMFIGRNESHHRGHEVRAIMEAVAHELRDHVTALCRDRWPRVIRSIGGAARSRIWLQIKSEILGCPLEALDCPEPTSLGAARLAVPFLHMK